jgi:hypothetical protein
MRQEIEKTAGFCAHCGGAVQKDKWLWCSVDIEKAPMQKAHIECLQGLRFPWLETSAHNRKIIQLATKGAA